MSWDPVIFSYLAGGQSDSRGEPWFFLAHHCFPTWFIALQKVWLISNTNIPFLLDFPALFSELCHGTNKNPDTDKSKYPGQCDSRSRPWRNYGSTLLCYIFHFSGCWCIDNLVGQLTTIMEPPRSFPITHLSRNTNSPDSFSFPKSAWGSHVRLVTPTPPFYSLEIIIAKKVP